MKHIGFHFPSLLLNEYLSYSSRAAFVASLLRNGERERETDSGVIILGRIEIANLFLEKLNHQRGGAHRSTTLQVGVRPEKIGCCVRKCGNEKVLNNRRTKRDLSLDASFYSKTNIKDSPLFDTFKHNT